MIVTSRNSNAFCCTSGAWRVWSLSDGHIDMPADLLRDPHNNPVPEAAQAGTSLRLSVNCFALAGPGADGILIDSGAGGRLDPSMGHLEQAMAKAQIDPASITVFAVTHTHADHINGLLTPDGRVLFPNLASIIIAEAAVDSFIAEPHLAQFRPLLRGVRSGDTVAERLTAFDLPGHAPGHTGYALDTDEDRFLFVGDIVHVPALQFDNPSFTWGYDDDQSVARKTRLKILDDTAGSGTWIAGPHLGWPGIGRVIRKGNAFSYAPSA
jgi:glyoxylase-like metal-dependent hydrolase (beta-lactamase superfamily II)